ncbi:MAG: PAS domain-containing protein [Rhodospirillaceae bacterium]
MEGATKLCNYYPSAKSGRSLVEFSRDFRSPEAQRLYAYWEAKRGAAPRPRLTDLDLMDIYEIAPVLTIRDAIDGGKEFLCRYWGTRLPDFCGLEATGKLVNECYKPESAAILIDRIQRTLIAYMLIRVVAVVEFVETVVP